MEVHLASVVQPMQSEYFSKIKGFAALVLRWYCYDAVCSVTLQNSKIWTADMSCDFSVNIPADF